MKCRRFLAVALVSGLAIGTVAVRAGAAPLDQSASRDAAEKTLTIVTLDVDKADIIFSPAANVGGLAASPAVQKQYHDEYLAGRQSVQNGEYRDALEHLGRADRIIQSIPDWNDVE